MKERAEIFVRLPVETKNQLEAIAEKKGLPLNSLMIVALEDYLNNAPKLQTAFKALNSISKNTCCKSCREARLVACEALWEINIISGRS